MGVVQPTQVSGGGWAANKLMVVGKDTQTRWRSLNAKMVKANHGMQYIKGPLLCIEERGEE